MSASYFQSRGFVLSINNFDLRCFLIDGILCSEKLEYAKFLSSSIPEFFHCLNDCRSPLSQKLRQRILVSSATTADYIRDLTLFASRTAPKARAKSGTFIALKIARQLLPKEYTVTPELRILLNVIDDNSLPQRQMELNHLSTSSATASNFYGVIFLSKAHIDQLLRRIQGGLQAQLAILVTPMKWILPVIFFRFFLKPYLSFIYPLLHP